MAKKKFPLHLTILVLAISSLVFTINFSFAGPPPTLVPQIHFATPLEQAPALGRREESRSRCPCYNSPYSLTALMPRSNLALTASPRPSFFFYVPHASQAAGDRFFEVEFVLTDAENRELYQTSFTLASTPGTVSFTLPEAAPPLEANKYYQWYLDVICDRDDRSGDSVVSGWLRLVTLSPDLAQKLQQATPEERPALYAQAGLWHDTLGALAELRRSHLQNPALADVWVNLLKSVGLEKIAREPLVDCCPQKTTNQEGDRSLKLTEKQPLTSGCQR